MTQRLGWSARLGFGVALALTAAVLFTACSSSGSSQSGSQSQSQAAADEQFCAARENVKASLQTVSDDIKALNFGKAKEDAAAAKTALEELESARADLSDATKEKIQPDVDTIKSTLASVQAATSLSAATEAIETSRTAFNSALQAIGDAVHC